MLNELRKLYAAEAAQRRKPAKQGEGDSDAAAAASSSAAAIPRFYVKRTTSPPPAEVSEAASESADGGAPLAPRQSLSAQVRREARTRYLENRAELLIDDRELAALWDAIQSHSVDTPTNQPNAPAPSPTGSGDASSGGGGGSRSGLAPFESEKRLHYDGFVEVSRLLTPVKVRRYMRPSIFLSFPQDAQGRRRRLRTASVRGRLIRGRNRRSCRVILRDGCAPPDPARAGPPAAVRPSADAGARLGRA